MKPFEAGKTYKTRDGRSVRILCTDAKGGCQPIVGLMSHDEGSESLERWGDAGFYWCSSNSSNLDLIPEPNTVTVWLTLYEKGVGEAYGSHSSADIVASKNGDVVFGKFLRVQEFTYEVPW